MNLLELWNRKQELDERNKRQKKITQREAIKEKKRLKKKAETVNKPKPYKEYVQKAVTHDIAPTGAKPRANGKGDTWKYRATIENFNKRQKKDGKEKICIRCARIISIKARRLQKRGSPKYCSPCLEIMASKLGHQ